LHPGILLPPGFWSEILLGRDLCSRILHVPDLSVLLRVPELWSGLFYGLWLGILHDLRLGILCRLRLVILYRLRLDIL
jgi:hypothetical protein